VARSSYFYHLKLPGRDDQLREQILAVLATNPSYGHRRVALALGVGKKKVRRVMKLFGIKPYKRKGRWKKRRDERHPAQAYTNQIKGRMPIVPNLIWVSDFTYLKFHDCYVYLATVMDLYTREIVGWSLSSTHTKDLVLDTFFSAWQQSGKLPEVIHSDQGVEYCSKDYLRLLTELGVLISMSKKASPWENGYQESFFDNFKTDLGLEFNRFNTLGEFVEAIYHQIYYYNHERIQLSLRMPPVKFKQLYYQKRLLPV
jgi:putative transposase